MKHLWLFIPGFLLITACVGGPTEVDEDRDNIETVDNTSDEISLVQRDVEPEELVLEAVEPIEPTEIEVINIGLSQDMDYPPFPEIDLQVLPVDSEGHFLETLDLRINNTKFGDNPMNLIFYPDGTCKERHQRMGFRGERITYSDLYEYKGTYSYDPRRFRLEMELDQYKEPGEAWDDVNIKVSDYFIINQQGLYDIYFPVEDNLWQKRRTEIHLTNDIELTNFILRGIRVEQDLFTFFQERRKDDLYKEVPDYQSARQYSVKGRASEEMGSVFYLEDNLLMKNDYVYLYNTSGGIVYRERLGE